MRWLENFEVSGGYARYLAECYQGEVFGEALMGAMADARGDPSEAQKLRVLEQLERETMELLHPAVLEAGLPAQPDTAKAEQGRAIGAQLGQLPWREMMAAMRTELAAYVEEFRKAESLAPEGKASLLRHITEHEQALVDFVDAELSETGVADSLSSVRRLLRA